MPTIAQYLKKIRSTRKKKKKSPALKGCPQKKGICTRVTFMSPKKPNSAVRKIAKVVLSNRKYVTVYIPGETHNLQRYSNVLVRGGRVPDLPGVRYRVLRGKLDASSLIMRRRRRSFYGVKLRFKRITKRFNAF